MRRCGSPRTTKASEAASGGAFGPAIWLFGMANPPLVTHAALVHLNRERLNAVPPLKQIPPLALWLVRCSWCCFLAHSFPFLFFY
jgi:hypothetical protein